MKPTTKLDCYVQVSGDASDDEDEGVQGFYLIEVTLNRPVDVEQLTPSEKSEIAKAVLDAFHNKQGIEVLDDFEITVHLPDGSEIEDEEEDGAKSSSLVAHATHYGQVNESDLPFELEADLEGAPQQSPTQATGSESPPTGAADERPRG